MCQNGLALAWASLTLQNDEALVRFAMANNVMAFRFASLALCNKDDLARQACKANPRALQFAETLQHDELVVMECILQDGACLAFASSNIRSKRKYIRVALGVGSSTTFRVVVQADCRFFVGFVDVLVAFSLDQTTARACLPLITRSVHWGLLDENTLKTASSSFGVL